MYNFQATNPTPAINVAIAQETTTRYEDTKSYIQKRVYINANIVPIPPYNLLFSRIT